MRVFSRVQLRSSGHTTQAVAYPWRGESLWHSWSCINNISLLVKAIPFGFTYCLQALPLNIKVNCLSLQKLSWISGFENLFCKSSKVTQMIDFIERWSQLASSQLILMILLHVRHTFSGKSESRCKTEV